jgi:hypothetical protein
MREEYRVKRVIRLGRGRQVSIICSTAEGRDDTIVTVPPFAASIWVVSNVVDDGNSWYENGELVEYGKKSNVSSSAFSSSSLSVDISRTHGPLVCKNNVIGMAEWIIWPPGSQWRSTTPRIIPSPQRRSWWVFAILCILFINSSNKVVYSFANPRRQQRQAHHHLLPRIIGATYATPTTTDNGVDYSFSSSTTTREQNANLFQSQLDIAGLSSCHGIFHASGCRNIYDVGRLTSTQLTDMGILADSDDNRAMMNDLVAMTGDDEYYSPNNKNNNHNNNNNNDSGNNSEADDVSSSLDDSRLSSSPLRQLSTDTTTPFPNNDDSYDNTTQNFDIQVLCSINEIYVGRLFTPNQCNEIKRMSEYHAYNTSNSAWRGMACKTIPGFIDLTHGLFQQLLCELSILYPTIQQQQQVQQQKQEHKMQQHRFESDSEPHLVKYKGSSAGSPLHTDTTHKSITINALLSSSNDFGGGGTYIQVLDRVIQLEQGQMLIHPGCLAHSGADITYGVRQLLVAFVECD